MKADGETQRRGDGEWGSEPFRLRACSLLLPVPPSPLLPVCFHPCLCRHLPRTRSVNEPGTILGRGRGRSGVGAGGGPNSAVTRKTRCVFGSSAIVRAPRRVVTLSRTVNLSGESS